MKFSRAFTIIELVFVIVVLGILASIALPKLSDTVVQADIAKGRGDVATIRSAIANERKSNVIKGSASYPTTLDDATGLFGAILTYPMTDSATSGNWNKTAANQYRFYIGSTPTDFTYNPATGIFTCTTGTYCDDLVD